jgi:DNA-binding response OmpR family regulator
MTGRNRVVIVDDEAGVRALLSDYLSLNGFLVRAASGGPELDACLAAGPADVIVLDLNMPAENGFAVARRLRGAGCDLGIIMLTAADGVESRLEGYALGIDDYLGKPFEPRELLARIRSVLRRIAVVPDGGSSRCRPVGPHSLHLDAKRLTDAAGRPIELTAREMELLLAFVLHPRRILSRDQLSDLAHGEALDGGSRSLDLRIMRLRRKIEHDPADPQLIRTVPGEGYLFDPTPAGSTAQAETPTAKG